MRRETTKGFHFLRKIVVVSLSNLSFARSTQLAALDALHALTPC